MGFLLGCIFLSTFAVNFAALASNECPSQNITVGSVLLKVNVSWDSFGSLWLDSMQFLAPGAQWSGNILLPRTTQRIASQLSNTGIAGVGPDTPVFHSYITTQCPTVTAKTASKVVIKGLVLGYASSPYASEDWELSIPDGSSRLTWTVTRSYLRNISIVGDRLGMLAIPTFLSSSPSLESILYNGQIPSFVAMDMQVDGSSPNSDAGYQWGPRYDANVDATRTYPIPQSTVNFRFSPSGLVLDSTVDVSTNRNGRVAPSTANSAMHFFGKMPNDGTAPWTWIGIGGAVHAHSAVQYTAGTTVASTWKLSFTLPVSSTSDLGAPSQLALSLPAGLSSLELLSKSFAATHNQVMGWMYGNNPASSPCIHEAAFFGWMNEIFNASTTTPALGRFVEFIASRGVNPETGYVMPRYKSDGFYTVTWGPLHDQVGHFVLLVYSYVLRTGDKVLLRRVWPAVAAAIRYAQSLGLGDLSAPGRGLLVTPTRSGGPTAGIPDSRLESSNWYDVILFGHVDAIVNVYAVAAANAAAELALFLGDRTSAAKFVEVYRVAKQAYNTELWSDANGFYTDWIDRDGKKYNFFYADSNLYAVISGIASPTQAKRIIAALDAGYADIFTRYNMSYDKIWSTPCNFKSLTSTKMYCDGTAPNQVTFPSYENGLVFFHTSGYEIYARAVAGDYKGAFEAYNRSMVLGYAENRLWAQNLDWGAGAITGGDVLNNALVILWGFLRGCFGVDMSLNGGVSLSGSSCPQISGGRWTFQFNSRTYCVEAVGGSNRFC